MKEHEIEDFCNELNIFLSSRFEYKRAHAHTYLDGNIIASTKKFDLYFRWKPEHEYCEKNSLTIARIYFDKIKSGYGSELLNFICERANRYHYEKIVIECANSNASAFAKRYGFSQWKGKDWIISTKELSNNLQI